MRKDLLAGMALIAVSACTPSSLREYIDSSHEFMSYEDLSRPAAPLLLKLNVSVAGDNPSLRLDPDSEPELRGVVARVLRKSGLVRSSYDGTDGTLAVTVERTRISYEDDGPGSRSRHDYVVTAHINTGGKSAVARVEHATISYSGGAREPETLTTPVDSDNVSARSVMIEQAVLRILREFQQTGIIPGSAS